MESSNCAMVEATIGKRNLPKSSDTRRKQCYLRRDFSLCAGDSREIDEEAKEWEHKLLQSSMDKELHEQNRCLEEKEVSFTCFRRTKTSWRV